jgi:hypothetical protein
MPPVINSNTDIKNICLKNDYLKGQAGNKLSYYQFVANFCLPNKAWITSIKNTDMQLNLNYLFDSRAMLAVKESACGFHSKLTSSVNKWLGFTTIDPKKMQSGKVQKYFKECSDIQTDVNNGSNWNGTALEAYKDDLVFGTAPIFTEEDHKDHIRYTSIPIQQPNFQRDSRGEIVGVLRNFKYTAMQLQELWPNNLPADVKDAIKGEKWFQLFDILHYVCPRDIRDAAKRDNINMAYRSVWIYPKEQHKFSESGFISNPYAVMEFWIQNGDTMAYSPAMDCLVSICLANAQKRTILRRAMKDADGASAMPARFWLGRFSQNPNAMNYYDKSKYSKDDYFTIPTGGDPKLSVEMMQMEQDLIDRAFFLHLFKAMTNVSKDMNNPEVNQRITEALELIGPVVGPMCKAIGNSQMRGFEILNSRGLFPQPPKEIVDESGNMDIGVIFLSPLAQAQKAAALGGLTTWLNIVKACVGLKQDAMDNVDTDATIRGSADFLNVDPTFVMEKRKMEDTRKKKAQAQQQQAKLDMAEQVAGAAKDGAQAHKTHKEAMAVK